MNSEVTIQGIRSGWMVRWAWRSHKNYHITVRDVTYILFRDLGLWEAKLFVHINGKYQTLTVNSMSYEQAPVALGEWLNNFDLVGVVVEQQTDALQLKDLLYQRISWAILSNGRSWS